MVLNILEQLMIIVYVAARCAATVAICYFTLVHYGEGVGKFWICVAAIVVGLSFSLKYDNPNNKRPISKDTVSTTLGDISAHPEKTDEAKQ